MASIMDDVHELDRLVDPMALLDAEKQQRRANLRKLIERQIAELEAGAEQAEVIARANAIEYQALLDRAEKAEAKPKRLSEIIEAFDAARKYLVVGNYPLSEHCTCAKCKAIRLMDAYMEEQKAPTT